MTTNVEAMRNCVHQALLLVPLLKGILSQQSGYRLSRTIYAEQNTDTLVSFPYLILEYSRTR